MARPVSLLSGAGRGAAAAAALLLVGLVLACGDAEEELAPDTPSATSHTSPTATPQPEPATTSPTDARGQRKASLPGGYAFSYPASWNQVLVSENPYIAKFFLTSTAKSGEEGFAELEVRVYENPENVALEEFYNVQERPNLFKDAVGGYRPFSGAEVTGYWFDDVLGLTTSTVVTLASEGIVYEFGDPDQKHQTDGLFSQIVLSFKPVEG